MGLHPSIPHGEGPEVIKQALDRGGNPEVATDTLVGLVSWITFTLNLTIRYIGRNKARL